MGLFTKFGEFDSYEELNKAAEGQREEGDKKALGELAKENGICQEDVEDYITGATADLCTPLTAAIGKIEVESKELSPSGIMTDWIEYITQLCTENPEVSIAVRRKSKSLKGCIGKLLKWGHDNMKGIDADIKKAAGFSGNVKLGMPGVLEARKIIKKYYLEGAK